MTLTCDNTGYLSENASVYSVIACAHGYRHFSGRRFINSRDETILICSVCMFSVFIRLISKKLTVPYMIELVGWLF